VLCTLPCSLRSLPITILGTRRRMSEKGDGERTLQVSGNEKGCWRGFALGLRVGTLRPKRLSNNDARLVVMSGACPLLEPFFECSYGNALQSCE
jgi:hypothetical protein